MNATRVSVANEPAERRERRSGERATLWGSPRGEAPRIRLRIAPGAREQERAEPRQAEHEGDDDPEAPGLLPERNAADVHAEEARDDRHRQRDHGDAGENEEDAVGLLIDRGRRL